MDLRRLRAMHRHNPATLGAGGAIAVGALALAMLSTPARAQPRPTPARAPCDHGLVRVRALAPAADDQHGAWSISRHGKAVFALGATEAWRVDLNGDGLRDLGLLVTDSCGSGGCLYVAYVNCGGGRYAALWGPRYVDRLRVAGATGPLGWRDLLIDVKRGDRPETDGIATVRRRFDGRRYR